MADLRGEPKSELKGSARWAALLQDCLRPAISAAVQSKLGPVSDMAWPPQSQVLGGALPSCGTIGHTWSPCGRVGRLYIPWSSSAICQAQWVGMVLRVCVTSLPASDSRNQRCLTMVR
jgi:hypothetical protein